MKKWLTAIVSSLILSISLLVPVHSADAAYSADSVIAEAKKYIGTPYKWGGTTPRGFDCSGFIQYAHKQVGLSLPRTAAQMYQKGSAVTKSELEPGDLIFFSTYSSGASHVGLYIGDNQFIHSASKGVRIDKVSNSYYQKRYLGSKRIVD
ncbi:C40 family peptidase [Pseudobacillus wudalianchiensis]|uniref:Peptidase P60 n=1 Tax=Pseudobacillus wudalianchiensis TaxID=1743143 RepID=A0A1B9AG62_9BACI|nr:C40 family peptidase [Bacillus wudalianchiensis]OCA82822.1 peptidase P60 [Bacillus wudalianchiensis]